MEDPRRRLRDFLSPRAEKAMHWALNTRAADKFADWVKTGTGNEANPVLLPGVRVSRDEQGQSVNEPMTMQETRQRFFEGQNILPEQRAGYVPRLSENMFAYVPPTDYTTWDPRQNRNVTLDPFEPVKDYFLGRQTEQTWETPRREARDQSEYDLPYTQSDAWYLRREQNNHDAWKLYLGMPQEYNTFRVSNFVPTESKDPKAFYLSFQPEIEDDLLTKVLAVDYQEDGRSHFLPLFDRDTEDTPNIAGVVQYLEGRPGRKSNFTDDNSEASVGVLGEYQLSLGKDEGGHYIAYYDVWDLDRYPHADKLGTPFEIYGRVYYDPQTFRRIR